MTEEEELIWSGMHRAASEALVHSGRTDDPVLMRTKASDAIHLGLEALNVAVNYSQGCASEALVHAALKIKIRSMGLS